MNVVLEELAFHELSNLFPLINDKELEELAQDIEKNGLLEPIVLYENKILDGRNRYRACQLLQLPFKTIPFQELCDPFDYVVSLNLHRRHLNAAQRAEIGLDILEKEKIKAKQRQLQELKQFKNTDVPTVGSTEENGRSIKLAASQVRVSHNTLRKVVKIKEHLPQDPVLQQSWNKALSGQASINSVFNKVKRKEKEAEQKKLLAKSFNVKENIICDSIENILAYLKPTTVDLILTDPPYPKEFLPLWQVLFDVSYQLLKPGGFLLAYTPHIYLPEILQMENNLKYIWTIAQLHSGSKAVYHPSKVNVGWKPILVFVKGTLPDIAYYDDVLQGTGREKVLHDWQQAEEESEQLIELFSYPNALVVDPFLGSGTTLIAAKTTSRRFFGMDIDQVAVQTTLRRVEEWEH